MSKYVNMLTIYVAWFLLYLKLLFWFFSEAQPPWKRMLMTSLSKSSNPCVIQVTQKPFLLRSVEIEKWLRQSTSFRGLTCESSRLSLDPKIWHGSYFYLEILVCKFWQNWKMDHLPMLRGSWLTKKSCTERDQLRGGLAKYVRVDTRFQFTT